MSDDRGPGVQVHLRFTRDWSGIKAGETFPATFYPQSREFYIGAPVYAVIGPHPLNAGLLERIDTPPDATGAT